MNTSILTRAAGLAAVASLGLAATASAHPSVFPVTAKTLPPGPPPATAAGLVDQQQYAVTNHGFTAVVRESNGVTTRGVVSYKLLPGAYRNQAGFTNSRKMDEGGTGAQVHATCDVAALNDDNVILAWQTGGDHGADPFYGYIPFQKASAGYEDDPADWIPVVEAATGVDLGTVTDAAAACTSIGGTYVDADAIVTTAAAMSSGTVGEAVAPLNSQIAALGAQRTAAEQRAAAAEQARDSAQAQLADTREELSRALLSAGRMGVALDPPRFGAVDGTTLRISGPALQPVGVRMVLTEARAKRLKLKSRTIGRATSTIGGDGTATIELKPTAAALRALRGLRGPTGVTFAVTSGDRSVTTTGVMSR